MGSQKPTIVSVIILILATSTVSGARKGELLDNLDLGLDSQTKSDFFSDVLSSAYKGSPFWDVLGKDESSSWDIFGKEGSSFLDMLGKEDQGLIRALLSDGSLSRFKADGEIFSQLIPDLVSRIPMFPSLSKSIKKKKRNTWENLMNTLSPQSKRYRADGGSDLLTTLLGPLSPVSRIDTHRRPGGNAVKQVFNPASNPMYPLLQMKNPIVKFGLYDSPIVTVIDTILRIFRDILPKGPLRDIFGEFLVALGGDDSFDDYNPNDTKFANVLSELIQGGSELKHELEPATKARRLFRQLVDDIKDIPMVVKSLQLFKIFGIPGLLFAKALWAVDRYIRRSWSINQF